MEWWAIISSTVTAEFSDITDLEDATRVSSRLLIATILGGLLGYERERKRKAAGLRTHMLVALGGSVILAEFPELCGVEQELVDRSVDPASVPGA